MLPDPRPFLEDLSWCFPAQTFPWCGVELGINYLEMLM